MGDGSWWEDDAPGSEPTAGVPAPGGPGTWWPQHPGQPAGPPSGPPPGQPPGPPPTQPPGQRTQPDPTDRHQAADKTPPPPHDLVPHDPVPHDPVPNDPILYESPPTGHPSPEGPAEERPKRRQQNRGRPGIRARLKAVDRVRAAAVIVLIGSILGLGYSVRNAFRDHRRFDPTALRLSDGPRDVDPSPNGSLTAVDTPDVREMDRERAATILSDAGVPTTKVTVVPIDQAGEADIVIRQEPPPGTNNPESVTLYVSRPVAMPDYVNKDQAAVVQQLREMGVEPKIEFRFEAQATKGAVLEQSVQAGDPMPKDITLTVAGEGTQVPIEKVSTLDSDCSTGREATVKGVSYPSSVVCSVYSSSSNDGRRTTFVLSQEFDELSVVLGVADDSAAGRSARFRIITDTGAVLADRTLGLSQAETITVATTGVTQLTLEASTAGPSTDDNYATVKAVFGTPILLTSPEVAQKYLKTN